MKSFDVQVDSVLNAAASRVYAIIADYRNGHPRILPRPPFGDLVVERGGAGAGTAIRFTMRAYGRIRTFRAVVTESEPGRELVESYPDDDSMTKFTVEPLGENECRVTIKTVMNMRRGLLGRIERFLVRRYLRGVYLRELALLEKEARLRNG